MAMLIAVAMTTAAASAIEAIAASCRLADGRWVRPCAWFTLRIEGTRARRRPGLWSDAAVDVDARRTLELEETFRREGLPNLIVGRSLAEDLRSVVPILGLVFVLAVAFALGRPSAWQTAVAVFVGALVVAAAFGVSNALRRRRVVSLPERVGVWESLIFVLVPAVVTAVVGDGLATALVLALVNVGLLFLAYL